MQDTIDVSSYEALSTLSPTDKEIVKEFLEKVKTIIEEDPLLLDLIGHNGILYDPDVQQIYIIDPFRMQATSAEGVDRFVKLQNEKIKKLQNSIGDNNSQI